VSAVCKLPAGLFHRCDAVLTYQLHSRSYVAGKGSGIVRGAGSAHPVKVLIPLMPQARYLAGGLAGGLGGVTAQVAIAVQQTGNPRASRRER
jgi:hypothetical protein